MLIDNATFIYDGNGNRVKKTEGGETTLYINQYYEKNLTTGVVTTYYYLGNALVAQRENTTLKYIHQDSLNSTSLMTASDGSLDSSISYYPYGETISGSVDTDKQFTGQRLDSTGLYYYNARYYDPTIGRFISADTMVPDPANPQAYNRYAYCLNNSLKYTDPSGNFGEEEIARMGIAKDSTSQLLYDLLVHAQLGDRLTVSYKDGYSEEYYFRAYTQYLGWDLGTGIGLVSEEGKFVNISDTLGEENILGITRYSRQPTIPDRAREIYDRFYAEFLDPYRLEETYSIEFNQFIPVHGMGYPYTDKSEIRYLADLFYGAANTLEFLGPGLSEVPPQYVLAAIGMVGIAAPEAAFATIGYYIIVQYGPNALQSIGDFVDPR